MRYFILHLISIENRPNLFFCVVHARSENKDYLGFLDYFVLTKPDCSQIVQFSYFDVEKLDIQK